MFHTDTFFRKTNLTSRHVISTGERQFDEVSFKWSLIAEQENPGTMNLTVNITAHEKLDSGLYQKQF